MPILFKKIVPPQMQKRCRVMIKSFTQVRKVVRHPVITATQQEQQQQQTLSLLQSLVTILTAVQIKKLMLI